MPKISTTKPKPKYHVKVKFIDSWLTLRDPNGTLIAKWAKKDPDDPYYCICVVCKNSRFNIDKGISRLRQHAQTDKHITNLHTFDPREFLCSSPPPPPRPINRSPIINTTTSSSTAVTLQSEYHPHHHNYQQQPPSASNVSSLPEVPSSNSVPSESICVQQVTHELTFSNY